MNVRNPDITGPCRHLQDRRRIRACREHFKNMPTYPALTGEGGGGMVDKLVGDGVHALFNTPLDLADHPVKAVHCAIAIRAWTEAFRQTPRAVALGLGRTRIGVETGDTIVG